MTEERLDPEGEELVTQMVKETIVFLQKNLEEKKLYLKYSNLNIYLNVLVGCLVCVFNTSFKKQNRDFKKTFCKNVSLQIFKNISRE